MRRTTLDPATVRALAAEVERQGGDRLDLEDLVWTWERVQRRSGERADVVRREARELRAAYGEQP
jgi:hypothetical protein